MPFGPLAPITDFLGVVGASRRSRRAARQSERNVVLGHQYDNQFTLEKEQALYDRARERGITPTEYYGSSAPGGAAAANTGAGQVLGNADTQEALQARDQKFQMFNKMLDRTTALQQTKMQTDAQRDVADKQVGATTRGQDIQKAIADGRLKLDQATYLINLRESAANIKKTEQETAKLINEVVTSTPRFVTMMKQLSMGPTNLLVELTMRHHGLSLSDKSFESLPVEKRKKILAQILALSSSTYTESQGAAAALGGSMESAGDKIAEWIADLFDTGDGIEATEEPPPVLGSRMSEPFQSAPNMRIR